MTNLVPSNNTIREISLGYHRYADLLNVAKQGEEPAIISYCHLSDIYAGAMVSLTAVPYFDGDNWPDILEDIIKYAYTLSLVNHIGASRGLEIAQSRS